MARTRAETYKPYFKAWRKVRRDPEITDFDFRLLKEFEDVQGKNTCTWVSQETLAKRLNKSRPWINERIAYLRQRRYLKASEKRKGRSLKITLMPCLLYPLYPLRIENMTYQK